jgi:hypothetical protein
MSEPRSRQILDPSSGQRREGNYDRWRPKGHGELRCGWTWTSLIDMHRGVSLFLGERGADAGGVLHLFIIWFERLPAPCAEVKLTRLAGGRRGTSAAASILPQQLPDAMRRGSSGLLQGVREFETLFPTQSLRPPREQPDRWLQVQVTELT